MCHVVCRGGGRLQNLVLTRDINALISFINNGYNINTVNQFDETALYVASYYGDSEIVDVLLNRNADPNLPTIEGNTPLHSAAFRGHTDVMRQLLTHGADESYKNSLGMTAADLLEAHQSAEKCDLSKLKGEQSQKSIRLNLRSVERLRKRHSKNNSKYITPFCSFNFDHPQFPREFISFIPVHRVPASEQDMPIHSRLNKGEFFNRYCKQWFGISVLLNQLNSDMIQSFDMKSKTVMRNLIIRELEVISCVHHPNIINLLAIIYNIPHESRDRLINPENLALVYERPSMGTMYEYIQRNKSTLSTLSALVISCQISEALLFLHSSGIVHCGITPHAIYFYAADRVKLGNFEYCQFIQIYKNQGNEDRYHSDSSSVRKSKSRYHHSHHHYQQDYHFIKDSHHQQQLPSIFNLLLGIYYLPANCLTDWLPTELYNSSNQLFNYNHFTDLLKSVSIDEIYQYIRPCTTSDVYSLAKLIQFMLPSMKQITKYSDIYSFNIPNNLFTLIYSALKMNPDERLSMRQFNRLLIHLYWVERDREKSFHVSYNNMPPCSLRLCNHKWKPRYCEPIHQLYKINDEEYPFLNKSISPIHCQTMADVTDSEKNSINSKTKFFGCLSPNNSDSPDIVSGSIQSINQNASQLSTSDRKKRISQSVPKIYNQLGKEQCTKKQKRSWHKIFPHRKQLISKKQPFHGTHMVGASSKNKLFNMKDKHESSTTSYSSECRSDVIHKCSQATDNLKENENSTSRFHPSFTNWLKRQRCKLSIHNDLSPDVNIKFNCETGSTPVSRAEEILSKTFNPTENDPNRKVRNLFTRSRLTKPDYVRLAAVPLLPEGVEVNPNLVSRKDLLSCQTPLTYSSFNSPRIPITSLSNHSNSAIASQEMSVSNLSEKIFNAFSPRSNKSSNSRSNVIAPMKPASHLTQLLSSSIDNPNVSGRIDFIRTSSLLARRQQYITLLKTQQDLNLSPPIYDLKSSVDQQNSFPKIPCNQFILKNQRVKSLPIVKNYPIHSTNHNRSIQLSFRSDKNTKSFDHSNCPMNTSKNEEPLRSPNRNCSFDDYILVQNSEKNKSVHKSNLLLQETTVSGCSQSKYNDNVEIRKALVSQSCEKNHLMEHEPKLSSVSKESIGIQCSVAELQCRRHSICDASVQTEISNPKIPDFEISESERFTENQQLLSVYNSISSNPETERTLTDDFFSFPRPSSSVSLYVEDSSKTPSTRILSKKISTSMIEIQFPNPFQKLNNLKLYRSASFHFDHNKFVDNHLMNKDPILPYKILLRQHNIDLWQQKQFLKSSFISDYCNSNSLNLSCKVKSDDEYYNFVNIPLTSTISSSTLPSTILHQYHNKSMITNKYSDHLLLINKVTSSNSKRIPFSEIQSINQ
uniref:Protein kinase n=1 Tax=Schistosoma mansoni TaxID=6183 RepID=A0A3Q0KLV5_SCHMA